MSNWIEEAQFDFVVDDVWRQGVFWTEEEREIYVKNADKESRDALVSAAGLEDWSAANDIVSIVIERVLE